MPALSGAIFQSMLGTGDQAPAPNGLPPGIEPWRWASQAKSNWCWAAVAALAQEVAMGQGGNQHMVVATIAATECARSPTSGWCAVPPPDSSFDLPAALEILQIDFERLSMMVEDLQQALDRMANHVATPAAICPVVVRWDGPLSHAIAVVATIGPHFVVYDPAQHRGASGHLLVCSRAGIERFHAMDGAGTLGSPSSILFV